MISFAPQVTERTEGKSKVLGDIHRGRVDLRMKLTQRKAEPKAGKRKSQLHCDPATPQPGLFLEDFLSRATISSSFFFFKAISGDFVSHVVRPGVLPNGSPPLGMSIQAPTLPPGLKLCSPLFTGRACVDPTPSTPGQSRRNQPSRPPRAPRRPVRFFLKTVNR